MTIRSPALAASCAIASQIASAKSAQAQEMEALAQRLKRFGVHAAAARRVAVYHFVIAPDAVIPGLGRPGALRNAQDQLHLVVALTGGAIAKSAGGLRVRTPLSACDRFEALAKPLIAAHMVAFEREDL